MEGNDIESWNGKGQTLIDFAPQQSLKIIATYFYKMDMNIFW